MSQLLRIRKDVLGLTQQEMADIAGVRQATVSRWERGELEPDRSQIDAILIAARERDKVLTPADFFDAPDSPVPQPAEGRVA